MFFYTFMPKAIQHEPDGKRGYCICNPAAPASEKKHPRSFLMRCGGVVLFRLLCPVSIGSSFSVYNLFDAPTQESGTITSVIEYVPSNIVHTEYPSVARPVPGISDAINGHYRKDREQLVADPLEAPMSIATVWMIGVLVMVIYSIVSYIRRGTSRVVVPLRDNPYSSQTISSLLVECISS